MPSRTARGRGLTTPSRKAAYVYMIQYFPGLSHASKSGKPFTGAFMAPMEKEKNQIIKEVRL